MVHLFKKIFELGILVLWVVKKTLEDTDSCAKQYRYNINIYLMAVLSSLYGIIMDHASIASGHGKKFSDSFNDTEKRYLKGRM